MVETNFLRYKQFREAEENGDGGNSNGDGDKKGDNALGSKITLGDGDDYEPFVISNDPKSEHYGKNRNLADIVKAFKEGANWGWSIWAARPRGTTSDGPRSEA